MAISPSFSSSSSSSSSALATDRSFDESSLLPDSTSYDLVTPLLLHGRSNKENDLNHRDFSYFHHWMPLSYCHDFFLQGKICKIWNRILDQSKYFQEKPIEVDPHSPYLLLFLLKIQPHIQSAVYKKKRIHISLFEESSCLPPSYPEEGSKDLFKLLPIIQSVEHVQSRSIRLINPDRFQASSKYLHKVAEIAKKIELAVAFKRKKIFDPAAGYDRLFLKKIILQLFPKQVRSVLTETQTLIGGVHIGLYKNAIINQKALHVFTQIEEALSYLKQQHSSFSPHEKDPIDLQSPARKLTSAPTVILDDSLQKEFNSQNSIFANFISFTLHQRQTLAPPPDDIDAWETICKTSLEIPFILRTFGGTLQPFLSDCNAKSSKRIKRLAQSQNLHNLFAHFEAMQDRETTLVCQEKFTAYLKTHCNYSPIRMHLLFGFKGSAQYKLVNQTAVLKYQIESVQFPPLTPLTMDMLAKIDIEQVSRSYYPRHSQKPITSVWINGMELLPLYSSLSPLEYYQQFIEALYYTSHAKTTTLLDSLMISEPQEIPSFDALLYAQDLLEHRELAAIPEIAFILKAGSFSSWGYADSTLRRRIANPLIEAGFTIKASNPQDYPTSEFYLATNKDFKTILTKIYEIQNDDLKVGEFVVKWNVTMQGGLLSSYITIAMIELLEVGNNKHETFLNLFNIH